MTSHKDLERAKEIAPQLSSSSDPELQKELVRRIASLIAQVRNETLEEMKEHFVREAQSSVKKCEGAGDDMDSVDYLGQAEAFCAAALHVVNAQREIRNLKQEDKE